MKRERLQQERLKRKKDRAQVASDVGISEVYVRMLENGTVKPGRNTLLKFTEYYGLGVKTLFPDLFAVVVDKKLIKTGTCD